MERKPRVNPADAAAAGEPHEEPPGAAKGMQSRGTAGWYLVHDTG